MLPHDVKKDADTGIWYFEVTDEEEEGKAVKTEAGKRIVPTALSRNNSKPPLNLLPSPSRNVKNSLSKGLIGV